MSLGDLGDVAAKCKGKQPMLAPLPRLTVAGVIAELHKISGARGSGSASQKQQIMARMLRACRYGPRTLRHRCPARSQAMSCAVC